MGRLHIPAEVSFDGKQRNEDFSLLLLFHLPPAELEITRRKYISKQLQYGCHKCLGGSKLLQTIDFFQDTLPEEYEDKFSINPVLHLVEGTSPRYI